MSSRERRMIGMNNCECQKFIYHPGSFFGLGLVCSVCDRVLVEATKIKEQTPLDKLEKDIHIILFRELGGEDNRPSRIDEITTLIMARVGKELDLLEKKLNKGHVID